MRTRSRLTGYACDIAFVTFCMTDALATYDEATLPCGYRYDLFGGFMGFCDHAGEAGLAIARIAARLDDHDWIDWIEIVDHYAREIIAGAVEAGRPLSGADLADLARAAITLFDGHAQS